MAVVLPSIINIIFNVLIFKNVRNSTRRVQQQPPSNVTNGNNNQGPRISRRDISLLKQMIVMFLLFVGGWTPVYTLIIIADYIYVSPLVSRSFTLIDQAFVLGIIVNFHVCNHKMKEYLINKFRRCIRYQQEN